MKFVDPKVATTRVTEHSLVYHVDIANHMAQDLRHIIKSLQNKGEVQRVRKEKALKAEMEKEEKRMKEAQSKAQIEDRQRHAAASRIASLLHLHRARHTVDMKRVQVRLRELLLQERDLHARATTIQRSFRLFSSRHIAHNRLHHSSKTKTVKELLVSERVIYDIQQRRICERQMLLTEMKSRRAVLSQSHQTNIGDP